MQTFHIHIKGRVQGVGFRPFVYKLAKSEKLKGWVCNSADGVHIEITTIKGKAIKFYNACLKSKPHLAVITDATIHEVSPEYFSDFTIRESSNGNLELNISPDFGMCATCLNELNDKNNRRYMYPFITCTDCGPRYSIISQLPYDRAYTSMDSFTMCQDCQNEYDDPWDRRYFSQTNSCDTCGIR
ncbi:MAG: acylphosphatase, partial [Bacteroidota bacterium]